MCDPSVVSSMKSHVKARGLPGFIAQAKFAYGAMNPGRVCK